MYQQRNQILDITGEPYVCCGGTNLCCRQPCESREPWLCLEACCCTTPGILSNRFMIQTRFQIRNDACDESIIACVACLDCMADLAACFADRETAEHIKHLEHCVNAVVCACMLAQQGKELERIEEELAQQPYQGPPEFVILQLPPPQQQMIQASQALRMAPNPMPPQVVTAAPAQLPMEGRQVQGRQMMVTVPAGVAPGQTIAFSTPEGVMQQATVPPGVAPGQMFPVTIS